uniref:Uncharacterized protein n=1 Tax=Odontella aurita TaxID=265563 RepID=A0A7S4MR37_9STRA
MLGGVVTLPLRRTYRRPGMIFFLRHGHDDNMVTHTLEHNIVMIEPIDRDVWTDPATFHFPAPAAAPPVPPPFLYNAAAGILQGAFSGLIHAIPRRIHWQLRRTGTIVVGRKR